MKENETIVDEERVQVNEDDVRAVLDLIRPAILADGGDITLESVDEDGVVTVTLTGACHGCPLSSMTLNQGVERILKDRVPGVTKVKSTENPNDGMDWDYDGFGYF
ncbi:MAG: NifU family protein [Eggerthellaceae bacterium]|jgi:Fe-S cluster biogenesis protein NfuA